MTEITPQTILLLLPEMILVGVAIVIYLAGAFAPGKGGWSKVALVGLVAATAALWRQPANPLEIGGPLTVDSLGQFFRGLSLVMGALFVLTSARRANQSQGAEVIGSLLLVISGMMLVASASDLVLLFVGLELISIPTYVLLYLGREGRESQESAVKYFFLSIFASAILLYGFSFLYGAAGTTSLTEIRQSLAAANLSGSELAGRGAIGMAPIALVLIIGGLAFKLAAVPLHFYAPDVYQGASNANAGLLAVAPKLAGVVVLVRIIAASMPGLEAFGWQMTIVLAMVTMTLGNVMALWQHNIRRMLAYSSIAHAGYMLIGLSVALAASGQGETSENGMTALLLYMTVYALATAGTFAALTYLSGDGSSIDDVDQLAGLCRTKPGVAAAVAVFMFSLAGIPPLAGFWGKLSLFASALAVEPNGSTLFGEPRMWFVALAVLGALNAAIGAAYYLRIVAAMYFRPTSEKQTDHAAGAGALTAMWTTAVLVVLIGLHPSGVVSRATRAAESVAQGESVAESTGR